MARDRYTEGVLHGFGGLGTIVTVAFTALGLSDLIHFGPCEGGGLCPDCPAIECAVETPCEACGETNCKTCLEDLPVASAFRDVAFVIRSCPGKGDVAGRIAHDLSKVGLTNWRYENHDTCPTWNPGIELPPHLSPHGDALQELLPGRLTLRSGQRADVKVSP